jgi:hypothetical protein
MAFAREQLRRAAGDRWVREDARQEFTRRIDQLATLLAVGTAARAARRGTASSVRDSDVRDAQDDLLRAQDLTREVRIALEKVLSEVRDIERANVRARVRKTTRG